MKPIVIAGNGPSLAQIDYSRLPQDFDVFRCNQFYFENKYFLGKTIKGVFLNHFILKEHFFTLQYLIQNKEYNIIDIYCHREDNEQLIIGNKKIESIFPYIKSTYPFLKKLQKFNELDKFYRFYFNKWPTMGIVMLYTAIAQGYKEIYLTGIDFYRKGAKDYAFTINTKSNLIKKIPNLSKKNFQNLYHNEEIDSKFIQLALSIPTIKIYAISPNSALCEILPLAPIQNQNCSQTENKPNNYTRDLIPPPSPLQIYPTLKEKLRHYGVDKENIYIRALSDLIQLFKAIFHIIKN